ncbi:Protein WDR-46 [Aphelenchoides avenae]|nr:Protein WDR-46 [Aphelenchus avenae]
MERNETTILKLEVDSKVVEPLTDQDFRDTYKKLKREDAKREKKLREAKKEQNDPFEDGIPIAPESLQRHDTGAAALDPKNAKTKVARRRLEQRKERFLERIDKTARAEILNRGDRGGIETEGTPTYLVRQSDIVENVDIASATKHFELELDQFGPYRIDYTLNGRHLLLGGKRGHVAAVDWMTKTLHNETNVMEAVRDVQWLHTENMYAVAQKRWTHIYDRSGTELHCLKQLHDVKRMEFLPRHFLLVAATNTSFLHYLDVSVGKIIASWRTKHGPLDVVTQNPSNAIVLTGNAKGTVAMWSPNSKEPLVELLSHRGSVGGIAVDATGTYMATTGLDKRIKIWDLRTYREMHSFTQPLNIGEVAFSQRNHIAVAAGNVFNDAHIGASSAPYMMHSCPGTVSNVQFCPYEDVLGVGHAKGFVSLLIPGSGDPNYDALKSNPFESKSQRREREVHMLLDKIQPDMITLNPADINSVNEEKLDETLEYKANVLRLKPEKVEYSGRRKLKAGKKATRREQRKQGFYELHRQQLVEQRKRIAQELFQGEPDAEEAGGSAGSEWSPLDRFARKT